MTLDKMTASEIELMLEQARAARDRAYVPYSGFHVGACLKTKGGRYYTGCNIENAAYSPTNCAERTALFKAVSEGERDFEAIAIIWDGKTCAVPCGVCRQALAEFCGDDMPVVCARADGEYKKFTLGELLPQAFTKGDLA